MNFTILIPPFSSLEKKINGIKSNVFWLLPQPYPIASYTELV